MNSNLSKKNLAVLFADISQSSLLYRKLGDEKAQKLVDYCLANLSDITAEHQGRVIKTVGDAIMACFDQPSQAMKSCLAMQRATSKILPWGEGNTEAMSLHMGLANGTVLMKNNDVYGDTVNRASHLARMAKPGQALTGRAFVDALEPEHKSRVRKLGSFPIEANSSEEEVFDIPLLDLEQTLVFQTQESRPSQERILELTYKDQSLVVGKDQPRVLIGRHNNSDMAVKHEVVSRSHLTVSLRNGRFFLIDHSANGTLVALDGEREGVVVHMDERELTGKGSITCGQEPRPVGPDAIRFAVSSK